MGLFCPDLVTIFFDLDGNLIEVQKREIPSIVEDIQKRRAPDLYDERIGQQLSSWQEEMGFRRAAIRVKRFFVCETSKERTPWFRDGIGIEDYPLFWLDILANPAKFDEDERFIANTELPRWEREGQFVLWWGNDYWVDGKGEIVAF